MLHFSDLNNPEGFPVQDAFYENLLCQECEARFQKWEEYAARLIYKKRIFDFPPTAPRTFVQLTGIDYTKFKLFMLSILWRMGVSKQQEFSFVKLGPHLERIRTMLLNDIPGAATDYGCSVLVVHIENQRMNLTRPGDGVRHKNHRMYRALIDGLLLTWVVGSQNHMREFNVPQLFLQEEGTWLTRSEDWQTMEFLRVELGKLLARSSDPAPA